MSANPLPINAGLTARLVYVQSCPLCREVAVLWATRWVSDPAVASAQLIASKKNHCCENGDALDREKASPAAPPLAQLIEEAEKEIAAIEEVEGRWCSHGLSQGCCAACEGLLLPISDTNGNLDPNSVPNGFDSD